MQRSIEHGDNLQLRRALCAWFEEPLGQLLQAAEVARLRGILPQLYGAMALQVGCIGTLDWLEGTVAPTRVVYDMYPRTGAANVHGVPEALPFAGKSINLVMLPHTLDFADDPHQVLREVDRVLMPEGHVVIVGFNPMSLWGLWRLFRRRDGTVPWSGHFLHLMRIKDWIALLDFELTHGAMACYRPPLQGERAMQRLQFMENAGDRWWPLGAAAYILVAKKREFGLTPLRPRRSRRWVGGRVTQPMAKSG